MNKRMTFEQHVDNGNRLKRAQSYLMAAQAEMCRTLPKSARPLTLIDQTIKRLGLLRVELDTQVGRDCPQVENQKLNHCYYGLRGASTAASGESG